RRQVLGHRRVEVEARREADAGEGEQPGLVEAARAVHLLDPLEDDEDAVADNGQGDGHLQHDQEQAGLVAHQRAEDGTDFHGSLLRAYWVLSWVAGVIWQARQVGYRPASRLAASAISTVTATIA